MVLLSPSSERNSSLVVREKTSYSFTLVLLALLYIMRALLCDLLPLLCSSSVIKKRRKEAFFSELGKTSSKAHTSKGAMDGEGPAWAFLRDNYILTNPKLKDWDKMPDTVVEDDIGRVAGDSYDDD